MNTYSVINLKTDPELKKRAAEVADKLGVSISAVLNNELRRFSIEESVTFDLPEVPNEETAQLLRDSRIDFENKHYREPFDTLGSMLAELQEQTDSSK